ncbi:MAG: hypothetical protein WB507_08660, partial [Solirubrobacterales bacterium]
MSASGRFRPGEVLSPTIRPERRIAAVADTWRLLTLSTGNSLVLPAGHADSTASSLTLSRSGARQGITGRMKRLGWLERTRKPTPGASVLRSAPSTAR